TRFAAASAVLGLATCVAVPAEDSAPRAMQSALVAGADLPDSTSAPARAPADDVPLAIPVTAPAANEEAAEPGVVDPPVPTDPLEIEDTPPTLDPRLSEVFWTAHQTVSLDSLAIAWGIKSAQLVELNPELEPHTTIAE